MVGQYYVYLLHHAVQFFVEYNIEKKELNGVMPSVMFAGTQDSVLKMNHVICDNTVDLLRSYFTEQKKITKLSQGK